MEIAKISVTENRAIVLSRKDITAGMAGATVAFEFDDSWDDLRKTYVWKANGVTLDDTDATGKVPHELLTPGVQLMVGVYGVSEEKTIPTLWADLGQVMPGADPSGDESTDPSLPVWAQIQRDIEELQQGGGGSGGGTGNAVLYTAQTLDESQQAQARENIGIGGIDKYGNATFPEVYAERVTICDQLGVGVYVETAYDEHGTPELYFYGSEGDERVALKNVERFHAGEVLAESLTFPYTTEDGEKYVNATAYFYEDRSVIELYDDTDAEVVLARIAPPLYDNEAANKRYVDESIENTKAGIVEAVLAALPAAEGVSY